MEWEVRFYLDEYAFKAGIPAFVENVYGDRDFVIRYAQNIMDNSGSGFKYFDIVQKG